MRIICYLIAAACWMAMGLIKLDTNIDYATIAILWMILAEIAYHNETNRKE